jgi:spore germination protein
MGRGTLADMLRTPIALTLAAACLLVPSAAQAAPSRPSTDSRVLPAAARATALPLTGFAYGSLPRASLRRDAPALSTVTVDGVGLLTAGDAVTWPDDTMVGLGRSARAKDLHTELLVHNYSSKLDDFDPRRAHRLLSDPAARPARS